MLTKTHHAQHAVEFLKCNNLGRVTMLILEKQRGSRTRSTRSALGRRVARVRPGAVQGSALAVALYFVFRDTLVAGGLGATNRLDTLAVNRYVTVNTWPA